MKPRVIRNEADHRAAMARIDELINATPGTPEGDELDLLVTLVDHYEDTAIPMPTLDPVEAIKFRLEQQGLRRSDLARILGSRARTSEIMARKRRLTMEMVRKLYETLGIPAESLIGVSRPPRTQLQVASGGFAQLVASPSRAHFDAAANVGIVVVRVGTRATADDWMTSSVEPSARLAERLVEAATSVPPLFDAWKGALFHSRSSSENEVENG